MNYLSVCSGIEAASVAWHPLGWNCVGVSEIEPFPSAVLAHHYPSVPNFGDMTKFKEWKINGTVDLLVGGTPCQSFSVAGLRQGLKDPRGNLMLTFLAIAEHFKPKWILWENVPGVLSSNSGKDFGCFLGGLGELGYGFAYRVLDAQWCRTHRHPRAVPQRRRRVFAIGCLGDFTSAAKVLFERESLQRYSAPRRATRQGTADNVAGCLRSGGDGGVPSSRGEHLVFNQSGFAKFRKSETALPLSANGGTLNSGDGSVIAFNESSFAKFRESDIAMPLTVSGGSVSTGDGSIVGCLSACMEKQVSNQMVYANQLVPVAIPFMPQAMQSEGWRLGKETQDGRGNALGVGKDGDPCPTLDRSAVPAVAIVAPTSFDCKSSHVNVDRNGVAQTLRSMNNAGSHASGGGHIAIASQTMHGHDVHAVAVAPTITATNDPSRSPQSSEITQQVAAVHASTMQVRRLTPTECERLQGFPDGWTAIPWKKKLAQDCPDGPRYKALGNSMAVNCMEWLGERIQAVTNGT